MKEKKRDKQKGVYEVQFCLPSNKKNVAALVFAATVQEEAEVTVDFFVERRYIHQEELNRHKESLRRVRCSLKEKRNEVVDVAKLDTVDVSFLKGVQKGQDILKAEQDKLKKEAKAKEEKKSVCDQEIEKHKYRLKFIYHTWQLLYNNQKDLNPVLQDFEEVYRLREGKQVTTYPKQRQIMPDTDDDEKKEGLY